MEKCAFCGYDNCAIVDLQSVVVVTKMFVRMQGNRMIYHLIKDQDVHMFVCHGCRKRITHNVWLKAIILLLIIGTFFFSLAKGLNLLVGVSLNERASYISTLIILGILFIALIWVYIVLEKKFRGSSKASVIARKSYRDSGRKMHSNMQFYAPDVWSRMCIRSRQF